MRDVLDEGSPANFPRGIERSVDWVSDFMAYLGQYHTRFEATEEAEQAWSEHMRDMYSMMLMRNAKSWFTGYNSNVDGHEHGKTRYFVYNGGSPRYWRKLDEVTGDDYGGIDLA